MPRIRLLAALAGALAVVALPAAAANPPVTQTVSEGGYSFVNFQLGDLPAEYCPDPNSPCNNQASEPQIRADNFGNFFVSSENGLSGGTEAWKSVDGGLHYTHLPSPNILSNAANRNVSPAGGDTDLATATVKNSFGIYNVYVASLELANIDVSTSLDGGHTWKLNPTSASSPGDDREWIAADGRNKVCISYHDGPQNIPVNCSYDAGTTFTQLGLAIDPAHAYAIGDNLIGNLAIDQNSNTTDAARNGDFVYQIFSAIGSAPEALCFNLGTCGNHQVLMGVSTDGGRTFVDHTIYFNPDITVNYGHQFPNVSVDRAGNVYAFFSDDHYVYYKYSTDHGQTWQPGGPTGAPIRVSRSPANTAIMPWSTAGDPGKVDLVYYGSPYYGPEHPDNYPLSAAWYAFFAQNLNAISSPTSWRQVRATPIIHYGGVCESGVACSGNRDLFDDFGVAARPTTGLASITYSDDQRDQYNQNVTNPSHPTRCATEAQNNTRSCDHTSIATQTAGPGIFGTGTPPSGGGGGGTGGGCPVTDDERHAEQDALDRMNKQRAAANLPALTLNSAASDEARKHSCDEEEHGDLSKRGSDGSLPADRLAAAGILSPLSAENIGLAASPLAGEALATIDGTLLADPASKANVLNAAFSQVGIGVVYIDGVMWLTSDFVQ